MLILICVQHGFSHYAHSINMGAEGRNSAPPNLGVFALNALLFTPMCSRGSGWCRISSINNRIANMYIWQLGLHRLFCNRVGAHFIEYFHGTIVFFNARVLANWADGSFLETEDTCPWEHILTVVIFSFAFCGGNTVCPRLQKTHPSTDFRMLLILSRPSACGDRNLFLWTFVLSTASWMGP